MDDRDDPYDVLGVSRDASESQIKAAYRKLALRHHPDKQTSEAAKAEATARFAKISNAYEVLSDVERRREYDSPRAFRHDHDDVFRHSFHDPFSVFAQVFGEEFGSVPRSGSRRRSTDPFQDSFFQDPFNVGGSMFGGGIFGSGMFGGRSMFDQMDQQMRQHEEMMRRGQNQSQSGNYYYSSSSSSTFGGNRAGESVTTSTRTINGKTQTVTERVITKPDGTVERHVETSGDEDFPAQIDHPFFNQLPNSNTNHRQLEHNATAPQEEAAGAPKKRRFFSRRSSKKHHGERDDPDSTGQSGPPSSRY